MTLRGEGLRMCQHTLLLKGHRDGGSLGLTHGLVGMSDGVNLNSPDAMARHSWIVRTLS